jgi:hypothetical protein
MPIINAHFDGHAFVPDEPLTIPLPVGGRVQVILHGAASPTPSHSSSSKPGKFADLLKHVGDLPGAPPTLSMDHDNPYSPAE